METIHEANLQTRADHLHGYRVHKELGRGATATVYLATKIGDSKAVALKVFHPHLIREVAGLQSRISNEFKAIRALNHPNIVKIIDAIPIDQPRALVLELVDGTSLNEFQRKIPYVLPEIGVLITLEILRALECAHSLGTIHRDLKPSNILISHAGEVFVTDFGLAKIKDASQVTLTGTVLGSPDYMSPEQAKGGLVTEASDLFSVTSILYFLITGTHPFARHSPLATLAAVSHLDYEKVSLRNPKISGSLSQIIEKGFQKNPEDRFQTAHHYRVELESYLKRLGLCSEDFNLKRWVLFSSETTFDAMRTIAENLAKDCAAKIQGRDSQGAYEALTHLSLVAPSSQSLMELTEKIGAVHQRKLGWISIWIFLVSLILAGITYGGWQIWNLKQARVAQSREKIEPAFRASEVIPQAMSEKKIEIKSPQRLVAPETPKPVRPFSQRVAFDLPEGVQVYWNGKKINPKNGVNAVPGTYPLVLLKEGFPPLREQIRVKKGEPTLIHVGQETEK